ncbi:hypothetical protein HPG69_015617 [Diceros bicornis minor]|uniref:Uncharacterized protein n=1 Tax=Diceros bicornis minor TaxID=77932 RepID=A0A7J7FEH1_DICBM|nr:hypothetical protein HPG69_015617 [Diceros bicornis minor]
MALRVPSINTDPDPVFTSYLQRDEPPPHQAPMTPPCGAEAAPALRIVQLRRLLSTAVSLSQAPWLPRRCPAPGLPSLGLPLGTGTTLWLCSPASARLPVQPDPLSVQAKHCTMELRQELCPRWSWKFRGTAGDRAAG